MAKPTLALIPSAIGDKLYSVLPSDGGGDFDLTRATTATRVNSQGLIETVASGDVRLDYPLVNGVVSGCPHHLIEPQKGNSIGNSEDITASNWNPSNASTVSNTAISPSGSLSMDSFIENTATSSHSLNPTNMTISAGSRNCVSFFIKKIDGGADRYIRVDLVSSDFSTGARVLFNPQDGTIQLPPIEIGSGSFVDSGIEDYGNGIYRVYLTCKLDASSTESRVQLYLQKSGSNYSASYTGDGGSGVHLWGFQFERDATLPTSYIPNNTTGIVTRDADIGVPSNKGIQTGDISSYVDGSNGVFYFEGSFADFNVVNRITLSNSTGGFGGDYISIATNNSGSTEENKRTEIVVFYKIETTSSTGVEKAIVNDVRDNFKMAISWDGTTLKGYANGVEFFSNSETAFGGFDRVYFSRADNNISGVFHGKQKDLRVYDTALTDAELVTLTTL